MKKQTLAATVWLYRGDHRLIIHHQGLEEEPAFCRIPRDVLASILSRLRPEELLTKVQYVCRLWRDVCWEPHMWRRLCIGNRKDAAYEYTYLRDRYADYLYPEDDDESLQRRIEWQRKLWSPRNGMRHFVDRLCRLAVDRSFGYLESITIHDVASDELLHYVADRSPLLKHLRLISCYCNTCDCCDLSVLRLTEEGMIEFAARVPFLEELEFTHSYVREAVIEAFARCCPLLVSFKFVPRLSGNSPPGRVIAHHMPRLIHLKLGGYLRNDELHAILDGCPRLESLDLYNCQGIDLDGELGVRCGERIKEFRRPYDLADNERKEFCSFFSRTKESCSGSCCTPDFSWTPPPMSKSYEEESEDDDYYYLDYDYNHDIYLK